MKFVTVLCVMLALSSCGPSSPVAKNAAAPPDNMVGDAPGQGLATPANAGAAERSDRAAAPSPTDGMDWSWDTQRHAASFGPGPGVPAFSIACESGQLVVTRFDAAPKDGKGTMSFTGNGHAASLPARSTGDTASMTSRWVATAPPSDMTTAVARVFTGPDPVEIALAGTIKLVARPSVIPALAFENCRH